MITFLAFLLTIGVLIVVHEWGHYRVAKACDVKVLKFSIGFGRTILRWQRGETEFAVSVLPLGGYVRMLDEREGPVDAAELPRAFNRKPLRQRAAVVAAGPIANLLLAVLLYAITHWMGVMELKPVIGQPLAGSAAAQAGLVSGDWVREISVGEVTDWKPVASMSDLRWHLTDAAIDGERVQLRVSDRQGRGERTLGLDPSRWVRPGEVDGELMPKLGLAAPYSAPLVGEIVAGGPADRAGLRKDDRVLRVDGENAPDAGWLRRKIREAVAPGAATARTLQWVVDRQGRTLELELTPAVVVEGEARFGRIEAMIGAPAEMVEVRMGPIEGLQRAVVKTWEVSALSLNMLGRMLIGQASLKNLSGPLTIADYAGQSVKLGPAYYLGFLALVSVSLGVLNLLPLPVLDGGHLMYYLFEGLTGRPVPPVWLERLQRGGVALMLVMMSLALYNDVARLLGLH